MIIKFPKKKTEPAGFHAGGLTMIFAGNARGISSHLRKIKCGGWAAYCSK
ncbi:hypothetical protein LDG_5452 [Legionella drancourtii LLAP12]|uniref:Uncharacterized protein n=1 Tax=Legionella drancourtii LLAP12 TaxID=658187 RepID=G9EJT7_9GAMM|nr:hypothetical protein LDG_5452 [Legionella drancourtii LLAP12]